MARRMIRFAGKKKRKNPSRKRAPTRRRRRRNPDGATAAKPKKRISSIAERQAKVMGQLRKLEEQASKAAARAERSATKAATRASKAATSGAKKATRAKASLAAKGRRLRAAHRRTKSAVGVFGEPLSPAMSKYLMTIPGPQGRVSKGPGRRKRKTITKRARVSSMILARKRKGRAASVPEKAIARAWKAAKRAQGLAKAPKDQRLLRAMGLAGVPNPSFGGLTKDLGTLMPKIGATVGSFGLMAVVGQKAGKWVEDKVTSEAVKPFVVPGVTLALAVGGWAVTRRMKQTAGLSAFILAGGVMAAALHALIRVRVGGVSIGQKIGLPIALGEYASMAGYGEYAAQAGLGGGTGYSGERGIFSGLDDQDPLLSGMDDGDEVSLRETLDDEGVNTDEGSLNGNIFD